MNLKENFQRLAAAAATAACVSMGTPALAQTTPAAPAAAKADPALFDPIGNVVMHPRCLNCHQENAPAQTDAGLRHSQLIVRGSGGHGAPALQCQSCHGNSNSADGRVPGAEHWALAPRPMVWAGLSKGQICQQMKDPERNGNRKTAEKVIEHMATDPLVLWAWNPGAGRSTPVISHAEFLKALHAWADVGMPCPK